MDHLQPLLDELIRMAVTEDVGSGDVTTGCLVDPGRRGHAVVMAKERLVVAGMQPFQKVFRLLSRDVEFSFLAPEGGIANAGETVAELCGPLHVLLTGERTALNFLQHLCGIATLTRQFVERLTPFKTVLLDTRKTLPGFRLLEKQAVRAGGGGNHRMGLFDGILIKSNHIAACGGIRPALEKIKKTKPGNIKVEVEVRTIAELKEALDAGPDMILLDNMPPGALREAVRLTGAKIPLEASGNISLESIAQVAATGVDFISAGFITHSARAADLSMTLVPQPEDTAEQPARP